MDIVCSFVFYTVVIQASNYETNDTAKDPGVLKKQPGLKPWLCCDPTSHYSNPCCFVVVVVLFVFCFKATLQCAL